MDLVVIFNVCRKSVRIGRLEFRESPVLQNIFDDGILRRKLIKYICRCGIACLCLFPAGKFHLLEQDLTQLFGRIDIKTFPCRCVDRMFKLSNPAAQRFPVSFQLLGFHQNALPLHVKQYIGQRHFQFPEKFGHVVLCQCLLQQWSCLI